MIHVQRVGVRTLVFRPSAPMNPADMSATEGTVRKLLADIPGRPVLVLDLRRAPVLDARTAESVLRTMSSDQALDVEREAVLVSPQAATLAMQFQRIIREAQSPHRRLFDAREKLFEWVDEVLSPADRAALRTHLPALLPT